MKKLVSLLLCLLLAAALLPASASVLFCADGSVEVDGTQVPLPVISREVIDALGLDETLISWKVTDLASNQSASVMIKAAEEDTLPELPRLSAALSAALSDGRSVLVLIGQMANVTDEDGNWAEAADTLTLPCGLTLSVYDHPIRLTGISFASADEADDEIPEEDEAEDEDVEEAEICKAGQHNYHWVNASYPTCTKSGWRELKCTKCGKRITETLQPYGHKTETTEATCTTAGKTVCTRCGLTISETKATGHKWTVTKQATCTEDGAKVCSICGTAGKGDPATGHNWSGQATAQGDKHSIACANGCGETHSFDHKWSNGVCTVCGADEPAN